MYNIIFMKVLGEEKKTEEINVKVYPNLWLNQERIYLFLKNNILHTPEIITDMQCEK